MKNDIEENIINENIINNLENNEDIKEGKKLSEEEMKKLFNIIINKDLENDIKLVEYEFLIKIIYKLSDEELVSVLNYLNDIGIPIFQIIINGFIDFDFNNEIFEKIIFEIISKIIKYYFNKNIFYIVYDNLSKLYRKHNNINNITYFKNIKKAFILWKLLYEQQIITSSTIKYSFPNISFFSHKNIDENNIIINFFQKNDLNYYKGGNLQFLVIINFIQSPILNLNKYINNFYFLNIFDKKQSIFKLKYSDIIIEKKNNKFNSFSEINQIKFSIMNSDEKNNYSILINDEKIIEKKYIEINSISKIEILNNFIGEISSLDIILDFIKVPDEGLYIKDNFNLKIFKNDKTNMIDNVININAEKEGSTKSSKLIKNINIRYSDELINLNKNRYWKKSKKDLSEIKYFGGLESFIPLFKLLKYSIAKLDKSDSFQNQNINEVKETLNNNLDKNIENILLWIKDILKIILKMICYSEQNYINFQKIIVPFIGSLAEILSALSTSKLISKTNITDLFNDEAFLILYIIILNIPTPNNIKGAFKDVLGLNDDTFNNFNFTMEPIIFDIKTSNIKSLEWYFCIIFNFIEFFLLYFDSKEKIPHKLIEQLNLIFKYLKEKDENKNKDMIKAMEPFIYLVEVYCQKEIYDYDIENKFLKCIDLLDNNIYLKYSINMLKTFLNVDMIKSDENNFGETSFYSKFKNLFKNNIFNAFEETIANEIFISLIIDSFKYYIINYNFLKEIFKFLNKNKHFISKLELIMEELIDYHGQYHHLMKELFIFNRLWSDKKLFFNYKIKELKESKLKYKIINYYTKNFQRPIIYPVLDYNYRYPEFSNFKIDDKFYNIEENKDDYNFELDCPELDNFIQEYNKKIINTIKDEGKINLYPNTCLIKQSYHVKGDLFVLNDFQFNKKIKIYFYSYSFDYQNNPEKMKCCNKDKKSQKNSNNKDIRNNLCYGSVLKCLKKECNRKIEIDLNNIRLILKRIYFYRISSLEIFTYTKSYYFNFNEDKKMLNVFSLLVLPCENSFLPINIDKNLIGLIKLNPKVLAEIDYSNSIDKKNNFIELILNQTSKGELCEMCVFDIIMLINLISNRSFIDLHQYPIFPLLYFYTKKKKQIERDLTKHIGFQEGKELGNKRASLFKELFIGNKKEIEEEGENNNNEVPYYFNTHYSNIVYTSNFLIRFFPFPFLSIELQGDGFDNPNRLFYSIEDTFYNISFQKSDLRELIPEFFYLPDIFINYNSIYFKKRSNNTLVDDVIMPKDLPNKNFKEVTISNNNKKENNNKKKNTIEKNNEIKIIYKNDLNEYENYFIFIEYIKDKLEIYREKLNNWIDLVFGSKQKCNSKKEQYFRTESYIEFNDKEMNKYMKDKIIMDTVEFGIIPLQTIFNSKLLSKDKKNQYEKLDNDFIKKKKRFSKEIKESSSEMNEIFEINDNNNNFTIISRNSSDNNYIPLKKYEIKDNYFKNKFNDYWDNEIDIEFKINNNDDIGKLEVYINKNLEEEIMDHNDKILDSFFNRRLNMFATTSKDGYICIYILPNKLFCVIKHPTNSIYDKVFLSSNPFPTVIAFDKKNNVLSSYSLSGILIKSIEIIINADKISEINAYFNIYGGAFKDRICIQLKKGLSIFLNVPFFDKNEDK